MSEMREEVNCAHEPDSPIAAFWFICSTARCRLNPSRANGVMESE